MPATPIEIATYMAALGFSSTPTNGRFTNGEFEVRTSIDGEVLARIPTHKANFWEEVSAPISIPKGVHSIFFTYKGESNISINGFELI